MYNYGIEVLKQQLIALNILLKKKMYARLYVIFILKKKKKRFFAHQGKKKFYGTAFLDILIVYFFSPMPDSHRSA